MGMDLSIGKLHQLVTVARSGSISKAAVELNLSQPALSRSIAAMENRYGIQIFNRVGQGVQLTAAGAQVIAQAEPLLQSLRVFDNNLRLFGSGKAGSLALGLAPLLASQQMAAFATDFFTPDTQAELHVLIRPGAVLLDSLKNDAIELFFFPEGYIELCDEIEVEPIGELLPACVVRRGHPLTQRADLTLEDVAHYPWASSVKPPIMDKGFKPSRLVCDNYHLLREAVLQSDLVCICSAAFVAEQLADGSLCEIRVQGLPLPPVALYVAKLRGRISSPLAIEAIARMRRQLAATRPG